MRRHYTDSVKRGLAFIDSNETSTAADLHADEAAERRQLGDDVLAALEWIEAQRRRAERARTKRRIP